MDQRFDQLYAAYFGNASFRWEEFTDAAMQYFDSNAGSPARLRHISITSRLFGAQFYKEEPAWNAQSVSGSKPSSQPCDGSELMRATDCIKELLIISGV
jgi:hypothetical protein